MINMKIALLSLACVLPVFIGNAVAAQKVIGLAIGNTEYQKSQQKDWPTNLPSSCEEAKTVGKSIHQRYGSVEVICDIDFESWNKKIRELSKKAQEMPVNSLVLIYYSGHGVQYNGYTFTIPIGFKIDKKWSEYSISKKVELLKKQANDISESLKLLSENRNITLAIMLDTCRDVLVPNVDNNTAFNKFVSIDVPPNAILQYATTPGSVVTAPDNGIGVYARTLSEELVNNADIGKVLARTSSRLYKAFNSEDSIKTYPVTTLGVEFVNRQVEDDDSVINPEVALTEEITLHNGAGTRLDVFWCAGRGEKKRYQQALNFAKKITIDINKYNLGRVRVRALPEYKQLYQKGYQVKRNIVRYDINNKVERHLLEKISADYIDMNLLPSPGVGTNKGPTDGYVSAFICE